MRILIVTQYFWPENFRINDLAFILKSKGHDVVVITGKPNYPNGAYYKGYSFFTKRIEYWRNIKVIRSFIIPRGKGSGLRLLINYFSFAVFASLRLLFIRDKFDKVFVFAPSPITVGVPGIVASKRFKAPMYLWVQDLWPASISAAGGISNKYILKIVNIFTVSIYRNARLILVQSKAFIPYILNQDIDEDKLVYFPNSAEYFYVEMPTDLEILKFLPEGRKIMFAGNIGQAQSFDTLLEAAVILKNEGFSVNWIVLGEGRMKESVIDKIEQLNLQDSFYLLGGYPPEVMSNFFSCADAMLVSLKSDSIFSYTIPSKIQSYLACGKPILTSLDGEGSRIIQEAQAGLTSPSENPKALADIVKTFYSLTVEERNELGLNARKYFETEFERSLLTEKLEVILSK